MATKKSARSVGKLTRYNTDNGEKLPLFVLFLPTKQCKLGMQEILDKLASSMGRKDEVPNQELAAAMVKKKDARAVEYLVELLLNKKKDIRYDAIKVIYEIGAASPAMIAPHVDELLAHLESKDNRIQWGAMTAIDMIASVEPKRVHSNLKRILKAADTGSVITRDHAVGILVKLLSDKKYEKEVFPLLKKQLQTCPDNQLPMYSEMAMRSISDVNKQDFIKFIRGRMNDLPKESQKKRIEKVIKKMGG